MSLPLRLTAQALCWALCPSGRVLGLSPFHAVQSVALGRPPHTGPPASAAPSAGVSGGMASLQGSHRQLAPIQSCQLWPPGPPARELCPPFSQRPLGSTWPPLRPRDSQGSELKHVSSKIVIGDSLSSLYCLDHFLSHVSV